MYAGIQQLPGEWLLLVVPLLAGVAVFLLVWAVFSGPLRRLVDRTPLNNGSSWRISRTFQVRFGSPGAGGEPAGEGGAVRPEWGTSPAEAHAETIAGEAKSPLYGRAEARSTPGAHGDPLEHVLLGLLSVAAAAILVGGVFLMLVMDAGSRGQGGRFYVALVVLLLLGALDTQFVRTLRRRRTPPAATFARPRGPDGRISSADALPLLFSATTTTPTDDERRYARSSLLLLVLLGAGLVGFALLFP